MRNLGLLLTASFLTLAMQSHADTIYHPQSKTAFITFMQGANLNAAYCRGISKEELDHSPNTPVRPNCVTITANGLSSEYVEAMLPTIKAQEKAAIDINAGSKTAEQIAAQKANIDTLTAEEAFRMMEVPARTPFIRIVADEGTVRTAADTFIKFALR